MIVLICKLFLAGNMFTKNVIALLLKCSNDGSQMLFIWKRLCVCVYFHNGRFVMTIYGDDDGQIWFGLELCSGGELCACVHCAWKYEQHSWWWSWWHSRFFLLLKSPQLFDGQGHTKISQQILTKDISLASIFHIYLYIIIIDYLT